MNSKFAEERPDIVVKFLKALIKGAKYIHDHFNESVEICSEFTGLSPEVTKKAMMFHYYNVTLDQTIVESLNKTASFLKSIDVIKEIPDWNKSIDKTFLGEAYVELG